MFHKLHAQLTLLGTAITGVILLALTGVCLFFAVRNIKQNQYTSFLNEANAAINHLQEQNSVSHQWISQLQSQGDVKLFLLDNGNPVYYQKYHASEADLALQRELMQTVKSDYHMDLAAVSSQKLISHQEFTFSSSDRGNFYVSAGIIPKANGSLGFFLIRPLAEQRRQMLRLLVIVLCADLAGILLLALFFNILIRRLLAPILENHKKQTLFISAASHELRSPLAVFGAGLEALTKTEEAGQQRRFIAIMAAECSRMEKLVEHMLLLANADAHSLSLHPDKCQPEGILLEVYETYEPLSMQKKIRLSRSLPEEWTADCCWDAERIIQALSIVVDNAISYTPSGGNIRLSLTCTGDACCYTVTDDGPGIPDSDKELIFERFYRADTAHSDREHCGLGLCIAREIVELHGGSIRVEDAGERGSRFILLLPLLVTPSML